MKYWAYVNNEILGPYEKEKLLELPVFSASILICPQTPVGEKTGDWKEASTYPEIAAMIGASLPGTEQTPPGGASPQDPPAGQLMPGTNFMQAAASEQPAPVSDQLTPDRAFMAAPAAGQPAPDKTPSPTPVSDQLTPNRSFMTAPASEQLTPAEAPLPGPAAEPPSPGPASIAVPVFEQFNPGRAAMPAQAAEQLKPSAANQQPAANAEHPHHMFSADIAESKLKPLSFHPIDQAPPAAAPHLDVMNFEVTRLGGGTKSPVKKEEPQPLPTFTTSNFDPMSLSQINRRAEPPAAEPPKQEPTKPVEQEIKTPEIFSPSPAAPAPEPTPAPVIETRTQAEPPDKKTLEEINSKLEALGRNSLTKQDIEPLKDKLRQLDESIFSLKNDQSRRETADKIQSLENSLSEMRFSLAQAQAPATTVPVTVFNPPPPSAAPEAKKPSEAPKNEIVDQGSSGKASKLAALVKKSLKLVLTLVLLAAVGLVAAFALKRFGVFDVTKFMPFRIPFLSAPQAAGSQEKPDEAPAPQTAAAQQPEPAKKDLSDEIIFIGRTYAAKAGGSTLENKIYEDAVARKGDFNKTVWQAKELPNGMFELDAVIPSMDGTKQLVYSYQVDYDKKTVQALDDASAKPLDSVLKENQPQNKGKTRIKKGRQSAAARPAKQAKVSPKPAGKQKTKQIKGKPATPADDEYEYVYEDEAGGTEEE